MPSEISSHGKGGMQKRCYLYLFVRPPPLLLPGKILSPESPRRVIMVLKHLLNIVLASRTNRDTLRGLERARELENLKNSIFFRKYMNLGEFDGFGRILRISDEFWWFSLDFSYKKWSRPILSAPKHSGTSLTTSALLLVGVESRRSRQNTISDQFRADFSSFARFFKRNT